MVTGPYQPWQVAGLVLGLTALAAFAGWRRLPHVGIAVIPVTMTLCWSVDAATQTETYGASLWPIGAAMVAAGTLVGVTLVASFASLAAERRAASSR